MVWESSPPLRSVLRQVERFSSDVWGFRLGATEAFVAYVHEELGLSAQKRELSSSGKGLVGGALLGKDFVWGWVWLFCVQELSTQPWETSGSAESRKSWIGWKAWRVR